MNNKDKVKYILSLTIFFLVAFAFIFGAFFNIAKRSIPSASAEGVTYSLSEDGTTLTISGTGEVTRNDVSANIGSATNVVFEDGITSIGLSAFDSCEALQSITFKGTSFPNLEPNVFSNVANTGKVYLNENLEIGSNTAITNLRAAGLPDGWSILLTYQNGYITDENQLIKYKDYGENRFDFYGYVDGQWRLVTYDSKGFYARIYSNGSTQGIKITSQPKFVQNGKCIKITYKLENTTSENITDFRFFVAGDTMINDNDANKNSVKSDGTVVMSSDGVSFFITGLQEQGLTAVPTYYSGRNSFSSARDGADPSATTICNEENVDSALVIYSNLTSLEPGQSISYTLTSGLGTEEEVNSKFDKADPTADKFKFTKPSNLVYSGENKSATVTVNDDVEGMGTVNNIKYYSDANCTTEVTPKNVGTYYVGITVSAGDKYNAVTTPLTNSDWKFEITKANPTAELFTFTQPNDLVYSGEDKFTTVAVKDNVEGMGNTITVKYYSDASCTTTVDPKNVGTYYVGITVDEGSNYNAVTTPLTNSDWKFEITKANPTADLFTFSTPSNLVYSGNNKDASVTVNSGIEGMGSNITVGYYSDAACTTAVDPKNVGTYYVGITVNEGSNYKAADTPLTKDSWNFSITKAEPTADLFTFSAPSNLVYSGNNKDASVTVNSGIDGMGSNITVRYYSDAACNTAVDSKNVGDYYVGITVDEGSNYKAANTPLTKDGWNFSINKAEPVLDFQVVYGGISGGEPIILGEKKEIFYGTSLKDAENILPNSKIGTWTLKNPDGILNKVGEKYIELTFTPNDIKNYDWSKIPGWDENTKTLNVKILISTVVDKSSWGTEMTSDGIKYYVNEDGTTSTEITGSEGIYWVKEESYDVEQGKVTSAWYGVDNSSGVFEPGSRLCIRWINKQENPEEWDEYHPMIDESETQNIPDSKKWIFLAEVIHPDGVTKYTVLPNSVPFYVQLGDDWDIEDIEARFISPNEDEALETTYVKSLAYPAGTDKFMKLDLLHFSPYVIYDKDNPSITENIETKEQPENKNYYVWIIVGGVGVTSLATLWWILYRKKKRNKENK